MAEWILMKLWFRGEQELSRTKIGAFYLALFGLIWQRGLLKSETRSKTLMIILWKKNYLRFCWSIELFHSLLQEFPPLELLMGCPMRSRLDFLHPDLSGHVEERQWKQKQIHNKAKTLKKFLFKLILTNFTFYSKLKVVLQRCLHDLSLLFLIENKLQTVECSNWLLSSLLIFLEHCSGSELNVKVPAELVSTNEISLNALLVGLGLNLRVAVVLTWNLRDFNWAQFFL